MNELEKIQRYIESTKFDGDRYQLNISEAFALAHLVLDGAHLPIEVLSLVFDYGRAKGYRAARAEMVNGRP